MLPQSKVLQPGEVNGIGMPNPVRFALLYKNTTVKRSEIQFLELDAGRIEACFLDAVLESWASIPHFRELEFVLALRADKVEVVIDNFALQVYTTRVAAQSDRVMVDAS